MLKLSTKEINIILNSSLFNGIDNNDIEKFLNRLNCSIKNFDSSSHIILSGYSYDNIGLILNGDIIATKSTLDGDELLMSKMKSGDIFGDILSGRDIKSPVTITSLTKTKILFIPYTSIMNDNNISHSQYILMRNLSYTISQKYFKLDRRIDILLEKNLRKKILIMLNDFCGDNIEIDVNMSRNSMAQYLGCDRSALSRELSRMKKSKIIDYKKSKFTIMTHNN